jgi:thermitase
VRFRAGTVRSERAAAAAQHGGNLDGSIRGTDFTIVRVEHGSVEQLIGRFRNDKRVADVVPNFIRHAQEDPNDASFWVREQPFETVRLPQAWSTTHGSSAVKIGIVDTGVDLDQPDLATRILPGRDFVNGDDSADDDFGHGTMVAGIAAADANNGFGIAGAAWAASIIPVKVLDATAQGTDA